MYPQTQSTFASRFMIPQPQPQPKPYSPAYSGGSVQRREPPSSIYRDAPYTPLPPTAAPRLADIQIPQYLATQIPPHLCQQLIDRLSGSQAPTTFPMRTSQPRVMMVSPVTSPTTSPVMSPQTPPSPPLPLVTPAARHKAESLTTLCVFIEGLRMAWPSNPQSCYEFNAIPNAFMPTTPAADRINWAAAYDRALEVRGAPAAKGPFTITDWFVNLIVAEYQTPGSCTVELQLLLDAQACKLDTTIDISGAHATEVIRDDKLFSEDFDVFYAFISTEMKFRKRFIVLTANAMKLQLRFSNLAKQVKNVW